VTKAAVPLSGKKSYPYTPDVSRIFFHEGGWELGFPRAAG
jgi:hypothetical protein